MAISSEIEKLERRWQDNPLGLTFAPLAEAYRRSGETARALELLDVGLAQHPHYVPAHIVCGRCHVDTQSNAEAEQAFRRVTELDPENALALKGLADLAEAKGRYSEAVGRLEVLLEVDRNNEEARSQLDRLRELMISPASLGTESIKQFEPADLKPAPTGEFQLADDAVALSASEDRFPEIVLHTEVLEKGLPVAEAAQGCDMIAAPDPSAARGMVSLDEEEQQVIASSSLPEPEPEAEAVREPEIEPQGETDFAPALEFAAEPEAAAPAGEPELMVTETMAEIFLRQGHPELALAVYSQLAQRDPANHRVAEAFATLQAELAPPAPPPTPAAEEPRYDAASTDGRSVAELFAALLAAGRPAAGSPIHPPAFEAPRRPAGEPTRPAPGSLSLSAVFGEGAAPAGPAGGPAEPAAAEPSFEQFFTPAKGSTADVELPRSPESEAPVMSSMAPEDLEQFNAWLRGLKR